MPRRTWLVLLAALAAALLAALALGPVPLSPPAVWRALFGGPSFFGNLITTVIIFLFLMSAYSLIAGLGSNPEEVPLSQVATDVVGGQVTSIAVSHRAV